MLGTGNPLATQVRVIFSAVERFIERGGMSMTGPTARKCSPSRKKVHERKQGLHVAGIHDQPLTTCIQHSLPAPST